MGPNKKRIRSVLGDNFQIKYGATPAWTKMGATNKTTLNDEPETGKTSFSNGTSMKLYKGDAAELLIEIAQTSKEELDTLRGLRGTVCPIYASFGKCGTNNQDFYAPEAMILDAVKLDSGASDNMKIMLTCSLIPQAADVAVTPSTGLPTDAFSSAVATSQVSVKNPYYIILETAIP